jgi:hypothetical protein
VESLGEGPTVGLVAADLLETVVQQLLDLLAGGVQGGEQVLLAALVGEDQPLQGLELQLGRGGRGGQLAAQGLAALRGDLVDGAAAPAHLLAAYPDQPGSGQALRLGIQVPLGRGLHVAQAAVDLLGELVGTEGAQRQQPEDAEAGGGQS